MYNIEFKINDTESLTPEIINDPYRAEFMPPLCTIKNINAISQVIFTPEQIVIGLLDGQAFTHACVINFCKLCEESKIALELVEEIAWLTSLNNSYCNIIESIQKMTNLLKHNPAR